MNLTNIIIASALITLAISIGFAIDWFIRKKLSNIKLKVELANIIIRSLSRLPIIWAFIIGIYIAISIIPIDVRLTDIIHKILGVVLIFSAVVCVAKIASGFVKSSINNLTTLLPAASILIDLTNVVIFVIGILIILQYLSISITPILTALGVGGLAIALALQDTLSNLFAGIYIILTKKIRPGDYIRLESGEEGYVTDISWRSTTIHQLPNNLIIIPNSKLSSAIVTNYYLPSKDLSVLVQVGVSYDSDLEKVEKVTIEVAKEVLKEVPGGVPEFEPFIRYHSFGDFSINFNVILRAKEFRDQFILRHEFIKRLHKRYQKEGIVIPFPIRTLYLKK